MVKDGAFGRIVKEQDEEALVDGIKEMLAEPQRLLSYSENIRREYSVGVLSWKSIAERLSKDYLTCI